MEEIKGCWRQLCNEELNNFYSANIIRLIKLRLGGAELVVLMEETRNAYKIFVGLSEEKNHLENLGVHSKRISKLIFMKQDGSLYSGFISLRRALWPALVKTFWKAGISITG